VRTGTQIATYYATGSRWASVMGAGGVSGAGGARSGVLNETDTPGEADFCNIQFPATASMSAGATAGTAIFGQVFELSVTEAPGPNASVVGQLGYGPAGTDPTTSSAWTYVSASFNVQTGNNDEYQATMPLLPAGSYAYVFRFSFDVGANFTYCDVDGAGSNAGLTFETSQLGALTVTP